MTERSPIDAFKDVLSAIYDPSLAASLPSIWLMESLSMTRASVVIETH